MQSTQHALQQWPFFLPCTESSDQGLINGTWILGSPPQYVLQWVNPIFSPLIHLDLKIILAHLQSKGCVMPKLVPTKNGLPCWEEEDGCWRVWSFIEGSTIHAVNSPEIAVQAGALVGRFHSALQDLQHQFIAPQRDVHNTPQRMNDLKEALNRVKGHHLEAKATKLAKEILSSWNAWDGTLEQPKRICHGDLKISNLRFDTTLTKGLCLIDLDTIGPNPLSVELGDAWRSWCNQSGEDDPQAASFDIDIFTASAQAWITAAPELLDIELESLVGGIERICLELSARFCADAINNSYFKENRKKYPQKGVHNLIRAQSQFNLARSAQDQRISCEQVIQKAYKERK
jgi:thiamine kinase-like enzyme